MQDNVLQKIIDKKKIKINNLKKEITLDTLKDNINKLDFLLILKKKLK